MKKLGNLLLLLSLVVSVCATMCIGASAEEAQTTPYVDDGLVLWLDGFDAGSVTLNEDGSAVWTDKKTGTAYTLEGTKDGDANSGWQLMPNGGVGYQMTADAIAGAVTNRLNLGTLPEGDYTIEIIMTLGDPATGAFEKATLYHPAFHFGGFTARLAYAKEGDKLVSDGGGFYMSQNGGMVNTIGAFTGLSGESVNRFTMVCDTTAGVAFNGTTTSDGTPLLNKTGTAGTVTTATYKLYQNEKESFSFSTDSVYVASGQYNNTIAMPTGDVVLFENTPATIYSVRVYDRTLSEQEMTDNHMVDLSKYYGFTLDGFYAQSAPFSKAELASFYNMVSERGFEMTEAEARSYFDGFALAYAIEFLGMSVEYTGYNGIRAVFGANDAIIKRYAAQGYKISYGAIVGYADDYPDAAALTLDATGKKAVIYALQNGRKNEKYVLAEELGITKFAITTFFGENATIEDMQKGLVYNAFMTMEKAGEEPVTYYLPATDENIGKLSAYNSLKYYSENGYSSVENIAVLLETFKLYGHIYVNPSVAESGDGVTAETALKSVPEAYAKALEMINTGAFADIMIHLSAGNHSLAEELVVKGSDFLAPNYSVTLKGETGDEKSVLSSTVSISAKDFTRVSGTKTFMYQLPESAKNDKGEWPQFRDLFIDGKPATMARTNGKYFMLLDSCIKAGTNGLSQADRLLYVSPTALGTPETDDEGNVIGDLEFWVIEEWRIHSVHIEHIDWSGSDFLQNGETLIPVRVRADDWKYLSKAYNTTLGGRVYWFSNNREYLDEKGEFYYDSANGVIYVAPGGTTMNSITSVDYPRAERLIYFQDAKNFNFENLSIFGTTNNYVTKYGYLSGQGGHIKRPLQDENGVEEKDNVGFLPYGAIYAESAQNITFDQCSFYAHGGDAINFRGAVDNISITNSSFVNIGATALRFGKNNADYNATSHNKDILIQNNYIENTGTNFNSNTAILMSSSMNVDIINNTILDSAYSAISVGWRWGSIGSESTVNLKNVNIAYNYIERFMTKMRDGGAIYTLGGNAVRGTPGYVNTIHDNYVVMSSDIGNDTNHWTIFYHDQGSTHWYDYNNVLVIHPEAHVASHAYLSYQTLGSGVFNLKTENLYVVGYHPDVLLGWGEYNRETGEYGIKKSVKDMDQAAWERYMPDWVDEKYPNWYQDWIVDGKIPQTEFFGFGITGSFASASTMKNIFSYSRTEDGAYVGTLESFVMKQDGKDVVIASFEEASNSQHFYLFANFNQAATEGKSDAIRAIAAAAGSEGHTPKYGKWTAR